MTHKNWYCPQPFKHAFIDSQGISPCCQIPRQNVYLDEWAENEQLQRIQEDTKAGIMPIECVGCYRTEQSGMTSLRQTYLNDYNHKIFDRLEIDFIDYRYSNLCNFKCRSCSPIFSHRIAQETALNPSLQKFYYLEQDTKLVLVDTRNIQWIQEHLQQIQRLMFTGGEPTVIPEVRAIIKSILADTTIQTSILITTNCSFTDAFWYDLVDKLPNRLHWTASIDSVAEYSEIIRHGTIWSVVEKNVKWLATHAESLDVNTVVSNMNIFQLRPLLRFVKQCQLASMLSNGGKHGSEGLRHQFSIATDPKISAVNWPPELKHSVIDYLASCRDLDIDARQREMIESLINQINDHVFNQSHWHLAKNFHNTLDLLRDEDHNKLFEKQD